MRPGGACPATPVVAATPQTHELVAEGVAVVSAAMERGEVGSYLLQAAIAAVHDEAARPEDTDWHEIVARYDALMQLFDNPMVALNHAVAVAMARGGRRRSRAHARGVRSAAPMSV